MFWPNCSNIAAKCDWKSEISQNARKLGLFWKNKSIFFRTKTWVFWKSPKGGKLAVEWVSKGIFSWKCHLRLNYEVFLSKKSENFESGKKEKMTRTECFFEKKKRFSFFRSLLYKNGKAQNMPLVAGRLVSSSFRRVNFNSIIGFVFSKISYIICESIFMGVKHEG